MAGKSFGTQLFHGFIRSAVNQVGRDGGKVISNRVYGDSHSTPIRGVQNHGAVQVEGQTISEDFTPEPWLSNKWYFYLGTGITLIFFFWLLWPFALINGIALMVQKNTTLKVPFNEPVYVQDRRYSDGKRLQGYSTNYQVYKVESPPEHRKRHFLKGVAYIILSLILIYPSWLLYKEFGWI